MSNSKLVVDRTGSVLGVHIGTRGAWKEFKRADGTVGRTRAARVVASEQSSIKQEDVVAKPKTKSKSKSAKPEAGVRTIGGHEVRRFEEYKVHKRSNGVRSFDANDRVARALRDVDLDKVYDAVARAAVKAGEFDTITSAVTVLKGRYRKLNNGMQRMNLGNRLRNLVAQGYASV